MSLRDGTVIEIADGVLETVDEIGLPSGMQRVREVVVEIGLGIVNVVEQLVDAVDGLDVRVNHGAVGVKARCGCMVAVVVGAGEADGELKVS